VIRLYARAATTFLIIEQTSEGFYLYTFPKDGIAGDTWHRSLDDSKEQATYEFGNTLGHWETVPPSVCDLRAFARENSN
jgi:hypothetical protein